MKTRHSSPFGLPTHPFWEFSLSIYGNPPVKEASLALQNRYGMNVNILLFCCWLGATGRGRLTQAEIELATETIKKWHSHITLVTRQLRNNLTEYSATKLPIKNLRHHVLDFELAAEHIEQLMLASAINKPAREHTPSLKKLQDTIESLKEYTHIMTKAFTVEDQTMMFQLLTHVFTDINKNEILQQCRLFTF